MYRIVAKENLVPNICLLKVEAPEVARKVQPGQFAIVRINEEGERIPLTIADWEREAGVVTIIFLEVGTTTHKLAQLKVDDFIANFVGPLGLPAEIEKFGRVVCAGGCYGIGAMLPEVRALKEKGNEVISIIEARHKSLLYWQEQLGQFSDQVIATTGDGSYGYKGWAPDQLREMLQGGEKIDRVFAHGCTFMMMLCSEATKPFGVRTIVSLNPIMVDGTGMCGACRVLVGNQTKFACVDGPEFDGHEVDWELLCARQSSYFGEEVRSLESWWY
jgi:ferredoxin--NADP+ reductase